MKLNNKPDKNTEFWQGTMSDIAFLLIVFFVLTALITSAYVLRISQHGAAAQKVSEHDLLSVEIVENGIWLFDGRRTDKQALAAALLPDKKYRLIVHDRRPYQDFIDVLDAFHNADIHTLEIVTDR